MPKTGKQKADWHFDLVADTFDEHVVEQLPWYPTATRLTVDIAAHFIQPDTRVYDIGAATGSIGRHLSELIESRRVDFTAIEENPAMAEQYTGPERLVIGDAARFEYQPFSLAVSFLTTIFMSVPERRQMILNLAEACLPGGAIIWVERMNPPSGYSGLVFGRTTLTQKLRQGADPAEAMRKEVLLSGIQRPLDIMELPADSVEFFRAVDFAGWVWEKP